MLCKYCNKDCEYLHGWGNENSQVIIVGEAPAISELKKREPFCGKAGKILEGILEELRIPKNSVYITNCVCYMPKDKEGKLTNPSEEQIEKCLPHLIDEIKRVSPKVIIALGSVAARTLTGLSLPISQMRGNIYTTSSIFGDYKVYPSWHPSYIARGKAALKPQLTGDIKFALSKVGLYKEKTTKPELIILDCDSIFSYIEEALASRSLLAFDIESTSSDVVNATPIGISLCFESTRSVYIPFLRPNAIGEFTYIDRYDEIIKALRELLEHPDIPKTAFNSKFDIEICALQLNIHVHRVVIDPMLCFYLLNEENKYPSLELLEKLHFPTIETMKSKIKGLKMRDYSQIPVEELGIYSAEDAYFTRELAFIYKDLLINTIGYPIKIR
jgi:uracil-DNA glycosylase family 4